MIKIVLVILFIGVDGSVGVKMRIDEPDLQTCLRHQRQVSFTHSGSKLFPLVGSYCIKEREV